MGILGARAVSTCIWSRCVPDRIAVCGSGTQGRRTRTSARQETLHSEPDETFNEREGWKRERPVGMNQGKAGDSGSTLISQIHFWLVPWTVDTTVDDLPYFFYRSPPCFYFNHLAPISRAQNQTTLSRNVNRETKTFILFQPSFPVEFTRKSRNEIRDKLDIFTELRFWTRSYRNEYISVKKISEFISTRIFKSVDNCETWNVDVFTRIVNLKLNFRNKIFNNILRSCFIKERQS